MIAIGDAFEEANRRVRVSVHLWIGTNFSPGDDTTDKEQANRAARRHASRANVVFCDGHVEDRRFDSLFAEHDGAWRRWNNDNEPHRETRQQSF
jgi:prepilin-type processing-associated H-X9-DG protein